MRVIKDSVDRLSMKAMTNFAFSIARGRQRSAFSSDPAMFRREPAGRLIRRVSGIEDRR